MQQYSFCVSVPVSLACPAGCVSIVSAPIMRKGPLKQRHRVATELAQPACWKGTVGRKQRKPVHFIRQLTPGRDFAQAVMLVGVDIEWWPPCTVSLAANNRSRINALRLQSVMGRMTLCTAIDALLTAPSGDLSRDSQPN